MISLPPFNSDKPFLRGNLHGHTTHSDGLRTPEEAVQTYYELGYDFICLSDHLWHDTRYAATTVLDARHLNREGFITIPSAELHCNGKAYDSDGLWHIVANGLPLDFPVAAENETAPEMIQRALDAGAYVTLAHPEWYSMTMSEADSVSHAHGVEIYNYSCVVGSNRGGGIAIADYLLQEGHRITFTATDDSHFEKPDWAGGWVMVSADLDEADIVDALKKGKHFSSSGADITDIAIDGDILHVACSPASHVILSGSGHLAISNHGHNITRTSFDLSSFHSDWFRITVIANEGAKAWSNTYWKSDIAQMAG